MLQDAEVETCRHHWVIQTAEGLLNLGVCRFCAEAREFINAEVWDFGSLRLEFLDSFDFN
ncbi:MAG: hypothetical protein BZY81_05225 [SAR202 cluster bacterium Io17-Chloro-G4]|nr:MAG: hypothetical protein BZY81_05225 [SAR202 cluster bacterium Io17-Chloro-G4]